MISTSVLNILAELARTFEDDSSDGTLISQINSRHANDCFAHFQKSLECSTSIRLSPETMKHQLLRYQEVIFGTQQITCAHPIRKDSVRLQLKDCF